MLKGYNPKHQNYVDVALVFLLLALNIFTPFTVFLLLTLNKQMLDR